MEDTNIKTIDEYIANARPEVQDTLQRLRNVIKEAAPEATEKISWGMPTFYQYGNLVHFALAKHHIGFYPGPEAIIAFENEASEFKGTKGSLHLPLREPLPYELIKRIVRHRVEENTKEHEIKAKRKK